MTQPLAKSLLAVVALSFWIISLSASFAKGENLKALNARIYDLNQEGKLQEALPLAEMAVEIAKQNYGSQSFDTALTLNNLATLYRDLGQYATAEPLFQESIEMFRKLGSRSRLTATYALDNLAQLYLYTGEYAKAEPLYQQSIEISLKVQGPQHPVTAGTLNNLGDLYYDLGQYAKSEQLHQDAAQIFQKVFGPEHPHTLTCLNDKKEATKEALYKIHSPYILHLATYGFFANAHSKFFLNPMYRSGLALAGAQTTIEAWKRDEVPPVQNDGILTAEDVSILDLKGTWLVTLPACDVSRQATAGEGVTALRRGFLQAGAQNLLMTLWPIRDDVTLGIMSDFYEAAHNGENAPEALSQVQRTLLVKLRIEKGLVQAVNIAGPFLMSSQ
jgi:hypothetical protein